MVAPLGRCAAGLAAVLIIGALSPLSAQQVDVWGRPIQVERSRNFDFIHYRVSLTFDLDAKVFWGENEITLTPLVDGVSRCVLDAEEIVITGAADEAGQELLYEQGDTSVAITFPRALSYGDTVTLTVAYRGENPQEGFFFDDASDDHPQMVSTDSWPDEAHHWIPLYDYPNDKVTHELIVTAPAGNKVLSNGNDNLALVAGAAECDLPVHAGDRTVHRHRGLARRSPGQLLGLPGGC
jgi:aminopeptidase N